MSLEPVVGQDGVYLMTLKERIPGYVPPLDQVRPQVLADFERNEARRLAREAAQAFLESAAQALAEGQEFDRLATAAGAGVIRPPALSQSTRSLPGLSPDVDFRQLQTAALDLRVGELSDLLETRDGAMVVHVISREPVDESRIQTELDQFVAGLRQRRRQEALGEWLRKELELAQVRGLPEELRSTRGSDVPPI
jgi:parvulin-like peptidyl-prolyl isomerase